RAKRTACVSKDQLLLKYVRTGIRAERSEGETREDLASILGYLNEEFSEKERLSNDLTWYEAVPHKRKVSTAQGFYKAFYNTNTSPIRTCIICYRKCAHYELKEMLPRGREGPGLCRLWKSLHSRLGCEHIFPDELKGLAPVEEKLIALNSYYGFITRYSIPDSPRQSVRYPRHIKGHITVFPNNIQELVTKVLPHPLLKVMNEIHVSWHGVEKPAPSDLSALLSVRRRVVETALFWLKRHNPHYADIEIDVAEMDSWGAHCMACPSECTSAWSATSRPHGKTHERRNSFRLQTVVWTVGDP
ncbi:hypothetical protein BKA56DRAFT_474328, partial [Ilyonectria sp. MPI-CAGE-AT-0026]